MINPQSHPTPPPEEPSKAKAVLQVLDAIVEVIGTTGSFGAPAGHLYAALSSFGCTIERFSFLMGILVDAGRVTKHGDLYRATVTPPKNDKRDARQLC